MTTPTAGEVLTVSDENRDTRYLRDIVRALNPNETREATRIIDALEGWKNTASTLSSACAKQQQECEDLRARLAAAESRLREYDDAPVVATAYKTDPAYGTYFNVDGVGNMPCGNHELIIRPKRKEN